MIEIDELVSKLTGVLRQGDARWSARCPAHDDKKQSLSVGLGEKGHVLKCHAGCETKDVLAALGLRFKDISSPPVRRNPPRASAQATYQYRDESGRLLFEVLRRPDKSFRQRRPSPSAPGEWEHNTRGVRRVPYRLPEFLQADKSAPVFIPEGEKDVDNVRCLGLVATTAPGGVEGGRKCWATCDFVEIFRGREVIILPDNDPPGRSLAESAARALSARGVSVKVLSLPNLPLKGDVSDWIAAGGTKESLLELARGCPAWSPPGSTSSASDAPSENEKTSQVQRLLDLALANAEFFKTPGGEPFASSKRKDRQQTMALTSQAFHLFLTELAFRTDGRAPSSKALADAKNAVTAVASFGEVTIPVALRVGECEGNLYVDLGDDSWRVAEITPAGWKVVDAAAAPVRFRRTNTMSPLPLPVPSGSLAELRPFLNAGSDPIWRLLAAWMTFSLQPSGPFPVLVLQGEQGSAKSTTARVLRALLDPSQSELRVAPKSESDLMLAARNGWVLAYDNLSGMPTWLSDGLCILATGGAYTTRTLYSNDEETILRAVRPVVVNGIDDMTARPDFASRAVVAALPPIPEDARREEADFWADFRAAQPRILGALFSAIARTLATRPNVRLSARPRMADFARWGVALEMAEGWPPGSFMEAYQVNLEDSADAVLDADPVAAGFLAFWRALDVDTYECTMSELLLKLQGYVPPELRHRNWPSAANLLGNRLRRVGPVLRKHGIESRVERSSTARRWVFWTIGKRRPDSSS